MELLKRLREADEQEQYFEDRTTRHISLVQKAAKKIEQAHVLNGADCGNLMAQVAKHDQSKREEPERTPYISITWRHKLEKEKDAHDPINGKGYETPGQLSKEDENKATLHHITTNSHHPEFHNPEQANIDPTNRDKSARVIDASKMPDIDIAEMVADWQAMSEELGKNTAREWFNKQRNVRWKFSPHQEELIDKLLKVFEGVTETVDQLKSIIKMQKAEPTAKTDEYMRGLANGLVVALATVTNQSMDDEELISKGDK